MKWRHIATGFAVVAVGLLAAVPAQASPTILRVNMSGSDVDYSDPALSYFTPMWQIEYATCANLLSYPDDEGQAGATIVPELAASMPAVSANELTYTFTIRSGFGFSPPVDRDVTAQDVKYTFDRVASETYSPAVTFMSDIVGSDDPDSDHVSGVVADRNQVRITLKHRASDFLSRLTMRFFCVVPYGTPTPPDGVDTPTTAGPYYITARTPGQSIDLARNPNYGGDRPAYFDQIHVNVLTNQDTSYLQIKAGTVDYDASGALSTADAELWTNYGPDSAAAAAGKQQYFVSPTMSMNDFALNTSRADMFGNIKLRQAVNYAVDRAALVASQGGHAGAPTDQLLPPGMAGFEDGDLYPLDGPDLTTAKDLIAEAGGVPARPVVIYEGGSEIRHARGEILKKNLEDAGFTVDLRYFSTGTMYKNCGTRGEPFDICDVGWVADYPDPFDFLDVLFNGAGIRDVNNNNYSYFDDPYVNGRLNAVAQLTGEERYSAYGDLDLELMSDGAPAVPWINFNSRDFLSERIGCVLYHPVYGMDLANLCLRPEISADGPESSAEGNSGSHAVPFTVSLSNAESTPVTLGWSPGGGTATPGVDYAKGGGSVTFAPGQTSATVYLYVLGDISDEPDETVGIDVTTPSKGTFVGSTMLTILDDDEPAPPAPPPPPPASPPPASPPPASPPPAPLPKVMCVVPGLVGKTLKTATAKIAKAHCRTGHVAYGHSRKRHGLVYWQSRRQGTRLARGTRIGLRVSLGRR